MTVRCTALWGRGLALGAALGATLGGCLLGAGSGAAAGKPTTGAAAGKAAAVEMPWDTTAVRDDEAAPIVKVDLVDERTPVPYVYGYPIYAAGPALHGIRKLRQDNWTGVERSESEDADGVVHVVEHFPELDCTFEGIKESAIAYVPWQMTCKVPAPGRLGGKKRPVVGALDSRTSPAALVQEPSLARAFMEDFHLEEGGVKRGSGIGYFNTDHGQLGFEFQKGRVVSVVYLFDAPEARWRKPELWVQP